MVTGLFSNLTQRQQIHFNPWIAASLFLSLLFLGPIFAVFLAAFGDSGGLWSHLFQTVLPRYVTNTLLLMIGVAIVSLVFGVSSAWLVVRYSFFGRPLLQWLLLLPAAVPAYLIAYTYTDFLEYAGPVQKMLRVFFGWQSAREYWFPEIRSMGGAMMIMGSVLYPYVYVMARAAFFLTPASLYEVGMLSQRNLFWTVGLPLARPAIAAGLALALMETISDFGTVEYFAIETLTLGIFNVWLGMNNLTAAAQISAFAFLFIIALLVLEKKARARRRFTDTTSKAVSLQPKVVSGVRAFVCFLACSIPIIIGLLIPIIVLLGFVFQGYSLGLNKAVLDAAINSLTLAISIALLVVASAVFLGFVARFQGNKALEKVSALASIGYAFPGTILAIGVVTAGGAIDSGIYKFFYNNFGITYDGWLTSGVLLIVLACVIRFQAIGFGAVTSGLERLSPNLMDANLVLGRGFAHGIRRVIFPLASLSLIAGGMLVFVDVMKELPMTLLLRPFNYETLPTYVYQFAKDELLEEAAFPALIIIATGVLPILFMNSVLNKITWGRSKA